MIDHKEYVLGSGMTYLIPSNIGISIGPVTPYSYLTVCIKKKVPKEYIDGGRVYLGVRIYKKQCFN